MNSSAALAFKSEPGMILQSDLLGALEISPDELVEFPTGLYGFPECRHFVLVASDREGFFWLQSADHSALVFLLVDPFVHFPGYSVDLAPVDLLELAATEATDIAVFAIVTLPGSRNEQPTANLQGPLAINLARRTAKQLAVSESEYGVRCAFQP